MKQIENGKREREGERKREGIERERERRQNRLREIQDVNQMKAIKFNGKKKCKNINVYYVYRI